jgi:hypothetical protein
MPTFHCREAQFENRASLRTPQRRSSPRPRYTRLLPSDYHPLGGLLIARSLSHRHLDFIMAQTLNSSVEPTNIYGGGKTRRVDLRHPYHQ